MSIKLSFNSSIEIHVGLLNKCDLSTKNVIYVNFNVQIIEVYTHFISAVVDLCVFWWCFSWKHICLEIYPFSKRAPNISNGIFNFFCSSCIFRLFQFVTGFQQFFCLVYFRLKLIVFNLFPGNSSMISFFVAIEFNAFSSFLNILIALEFKYFAKHFVICFRKQCWYCQFIKKAK